MCFDINFDLNKKAQLVVGDNMKGYRDNYYYCGVVNIDNVRTFFFFSHINNIDLYASDIGNAYPCGLAN